MKQKIDWGLKFWREVFKLESLHFGYWENIKEINLENLRIAQKNYIQKLIHLFPKNVKMVLDVGAGTGEVAKELISRGYYVESVSPDPYQQQIFSQKCPQTKFYLSKFEDLSLQEDKKFDLILMAESCQYLNLDLAFKNCQKLLSDNGKILICDYFRKQNISYYKTTHVWQDFIFYAEKNKFKIIYEEDITNYVLPTLTLGKNYYTQYVLPILEIISGYLSEKIPIISKIANFIFYKKIKKLKYYLYEHTKDKLDTQKFLEFMQYKIVILQRN
ncbi:MAG: class I SAM-dependent methyltransferase [Endomicrobiia bacterium]